jgi:hypothetical protein
MLCASVRMMVAPLVCGLVSVVSRSQRGISAARQARCFYRLGLSD